MTQAFVLYHAKHAMKEDPDPVIVLYMVLFLVYVTYLLIKRKP